MAEPLANLRNSSDVTQAVSLGFHTAMDDLDIEAKALRENRKKLRLRIKQAGINLRGFDRARTDSERAANDREAEDFEYRRQMAWKSKPIGFAPSLDLNEAVDEGLRALNVHELHRIDTDGFEAGKAGKKRSVNTWPLGSEAYQRWDTAWVRGQADIASTLGGPANGTTAANDATGSDERPKRGRGRPRKDGSPAQPTHPAPGSEQ